MAPPECHADLDARINTLREALRSDQPPQQRLTGIHKALGRMEVDLSALTVRLGTATRQQNEWPAQAKLRHDQLEALL